MRSPQPNFIEKLQAFLVKYYYIVFPLTIAVVATLVYANTLRVPFQYDDSYYIVDNPGIRSFSLHQFPTLFGTTRQIAFLSFFLNYKFSGYSVTGFHVLNILIHISNALLAYWLALFTLRTPFFRQRIKSISGVTAAVAALFVALVFATHPVQTQAVTYITQRFASLATFFYLASLFLYIKSRMVSTYDSGSRSGRDYSHRRVLLYAGAVGCAILAMRTKEISFTLPAVAVLYEFTFFAGDIKNRVLGLLPLLGTWLMIPLNLIGGDGSAQSAIDVARGETVLISSSDYLLTQFRVIVTYIRLFFFPAGQNLDYDYPLYKSLASPDVLVSIGLLAGIAGAGIYLFRRSGGKDPLLRLTAFGIFWFFITLSVESSINPLGTLIDEHRLYLASVGLILAVMGALWTAWERWKSSRPIVARAVLPLGLVIIALLSAMTIARNIVWRDEISLWQDTAAKSPDKVRPHYNLGNAYIHGGSIQKGISEFKRAVEIQPNFEPALNNLGTVYMNLGQYDQAAATLEQALAANPEKDLSAGDSGSLHLEANPVVDHFPLLANLGICYIKLGKFEQAAAALAQATSLNPNHWESHYNLGISYQAIGQKNKAVDEFQTVLLLNPGFSEARNKLQALLAQS